MKRAIAIIGAVLAALLAYVPLAAGDEIVFYHAKRHPVAKIRITESIAECQEGSTWAKVIFKEVVTGVGTPAQVRRAERHAARRVFWTSDICSLELSASEEWKGRDPTFLSVIAFSMRPEEEAPGEWELGSAGSFLDISLSYAQTGGAIPFSAQRVTVRTRDREVSRRLAFFGQRNGHYERIYEGSDAFVNYCIDHSKEIRSSHGRLYCIKWVPSTGRESIKWQKKATARSS